MKTHLLSARILVLLSALLMSQLSFSAPGSSLEDPTGFEVAADLFLARPAGVVATVLGTGVWVVGLPFNAAGGNLKDSAETLMLDPLKMTFWRCLGCKHPGYKAD